MSSLFMMKGSGLHNAHEYTIKPVEQIRDIWEIFHTDHSLSADIPKCAINPELIQ